MEELAVAALVVLIIIVAVWWTDRRERRFFEMLHAVARRVSGTAVVGEGLEASGEGWKAEVRFKRRKKPYTRVEFEFVRPVPAVRVAKQGVLHRLARFFGVRDFEIGDPEFDGRFLISAADPDGARRFFSPSVRAAFDWLAGFPDLVFEVAGTRGRIWTGEFPRGADPLTEFLRCAYTLAGAILGAELVCTIASEGACQVCGQPLGGDAVRCAKCATPHHRECWEYIDQCSTFACGEKRFV